MNELTFLWWVTMLWVGSSRTSYLRRRRRSLFECVLFECVYKHSMTSMLNWIPSTFCHTLFCLSVHSKTIISINSNYCFEFCWEVSLSGSSFFRVALAGAKRRLVLIFILGATTCRCRRCRRSARTDHRYQLGLFLQHFQHTPPAGQEQHQ